MTSILIFLLIILTLVYLGGYVIYESRKDLFQPIILVGVIFVVFYISDIIYILFDSEIKSTFPLSGINFNYTMVDEICFLIIMTIIMWILGDFFISKIKYRKNKTYYNDILEGPSKLGYLNTVGFLVCGILLLELVYFISFINKLGGLVWYLEHIADRALIFSDNSIFYGMIQLTTVIGSIIAGYYLSIIKTRDSNTLLKFMTVLVIMLLLILTLLTGARANILKSIIIMLVILHYFGIKLKINFKFMVSFLILGLVFINFAVQTRNVEINDNTSMLDNTFNGVEISQVNNIMILEQYSMVAEKHGSTIIGGFFSFIPRSLIELLGGEKMAGGNQEFTKDVWPSRWNRSQSEVALGVFGELVYNFGYLVTPLISFLLGAFYRILYISLVKQSRLGVLGYIVYIGILWSIFQLLRGDIYNTVNNFFIYLIACILAFGLIKLITNNNKLRYLR